MKSEMDKKRLVEYYEAMFKIRSFEKNLLKMFSENKISGTTHTCIGQEAVAVAAMKNINADDIIFSNHRCHGHFIAYANNIEILLAEIMGKKTGVCHGRGGSQHLCYKRFFSNGVQGGIVPNAVGMAWAEKMKGSDNIAIVFLGDGTLGQGVVYESFNIAAIFEIPILFVVENNEYAMTTKIQDALAGTIQGRANAFGIANSECDDRNIHELDKSFKAAMAYVRQEKKPFCQIVNTYRLAAHSKGDDFRNKTEVDKHWIMDPLKSLEEELESQEVREIQEVVLRELSETIQKCETIVEDILDEKNYIEHIKNDSGQDSILNSESNKMIQQLNSGLAELVETHSEIVILGEDVRDPYGGAFKATKGISIHWSDQIKNTPISEAALVGIGVGLAMNGQKPIVEMMCGDFITLGFDQILNHATKYNWLYADQVKVPLLVRIPSGGGRGYGATHSQTLEKYFVGIPNLRLVALSPIWNCKKMVKRVIEYMDEPTFLIENKKMYGEKMKVVKNQRIEQFFITETDDVFPAAQLSLDNTQKAEAVVVTYGAMTNVAMEAAKILFVEEEILLNIIIVTQISPFDVSKIKGFLNDEEYVFSLEEGNIRAGWGSEVISALCESGIKTVFHRIGAKNCVISCNKKEEATILPTSRSVANEIRGVLYGTRN